MTNHTVTLSDIIQSRISSYDSLSELELIFQDIYNQDTEKDRRMKLDFYKKNIADQKLQKDFNDIMSIKGFIPEDAFFHGNENIVINLHPRYMPALKHNHDFVEIMFVMRGHIVQTIGDCNVSLNPGDICFISPSTIHSPEAYDDETLLVNILLRQKTLHSTFANCLMEQDVISTFFMRILCGQTHQPYLLWHVHNDEKIWHLILNMLDCYNTADSYTDRLLHTMVEQVFIYLLRDHTPDFSTGNFQKENDQNILTIMEYAQSHYDTITLTALADHFNYNTAYLSRMLKTYLGCPFSKYFIDLRLSKAAELLTKTERPVSDILEQVGYTDKTHFYRAFQKKYNMTPHIYRLQFCDNRVSSSP